MDENNPAAAGALNQIIKTLNQLDPETRKRVFRAVSSFFQDESEIAPSRDLATQHGT
jgi:oligoendopeptidase F